MTATNTVEIEPPDHSEALAWVFRYTKEQWRVLCIWGVNGDLSCECGDPHDRSKNEDLDPKNIGKHPYLGLSWSKGTTDPTVFEKWFAPGMHHNVAIVPALSGLFVVDIDGDKGGEQSAELLDLPETLEAITGNGRHLYYKAEDVETIGSNDLGTGIDTRGNTGYVIAPPSLHRCGRRYEWKNWL